MIVRTAFVAALLFTGVAAAQAARLQIGQTGYLSSNALACPTHASANSVLKIANTDFDAAVAKGTAEGCATLSKGAEVFVVEVPNAILACVRPKGGKSCVWTAQSRVVAID